MEGMITSVVHSFTKDRDYTVCVSNSYQQVTQLEIDDGNTIQVLDIDSNKPFAIVLPINAGNITFYDVNRNTVEYWNNHL